MALARMCGRNGPRTEWTVKKVREDQDEIFYDEMEAMREN